ncbi:MAG: co-chaperone YbbN [Gammaproteobacteria bacterium]|jgi:putative thioredoxin
MYSIDVTEQNFQQQVLEKSKTVPVVVDFWAPWCGPCQTLKPLLEKLAEEYQGKFLLAKVNADDNQALASQFGVRGIPSVKAVYNGKLVNEFSGAIPEPTLRKFLEEIIPNESETKRQAALAKYEQGDIDAAVTLLQEVVELDDDNQNAKIDLAALLIENKDFDNARSLLNKVPLNLQQEDRFKELMTRIDLSERSGQVADKEALVQRITQDETDLQARLDLANHYIATQSYEEALALLFDIIKKDRNFGDDIARKTVLDIFTLLGNQDERVRSARKTLASLLN